ncbi:hypothetical protein JR316_0003193 [Psilocybe cubensis]|uniref:Uncharacterized protein n=2 Tax=Psilocybe cubensis TaxID=181762 RepID=A0A8H7Y1K2_PSICU|nr:hypothetical protein JR316_0003193 [Psilocybe cubensis]KAH9483717.1 hypothetical protein JR316_0003193 [Psilocybe cubensis]
MFSPVLIVTSLILKVGFSQASVQCLNTYLWSYNTQNQSPCDVASALLSECVADGSLVPLPNNPQGQSYYDPYRARATPSILLHNDQVNSYPEPIPPGLDVPRWAYMDVTTTDFFHVDEAFYNATASGKSSGTQTQTFSTPSNALPTTAAPDSTVGTSITNSNVTYNMAPASSDSDKGSKTDIGALIGAITGAVTGLVIVTLSVLRYLAFRKKRKEKESLRDEENHGLVSPTPTFVQSKGSKRFKKEAQEDEWDSEIEMDIKGEANFHFHT